MATCHAHSAPLLFTTNSAHIIYISAQVKQFLDQLIWLMRTDDNDPKGIYSDTGLHMEGLAL